MASRNNRNGRNQNVAGNHDGSARIHGKQDKTDGRVKFYEFFDYFVEEGEQYEDLVEKVRKALWYNRSTNKLIVLELHHKYVDFPKISVYIKPSDLYLLGIGFDGGKKYEFGTFDVGLISFNSEPLGYGENYNELGGLGNVTIGYESFVHAVKQISKGKDLGNREEVNKWKNRITSSLATLTVMLCEGTRFNPLFDKFNKLLREGSNQCTNSSDNRVETWMIALINNWKVISDTALNGEVSGNEDRKPPTEDHEYDVNDAEMAVNYKDWAIHAIAVNHHTDALPYVPIVCYQNFHLVIVGDEKTGKTTFVKTYLNGAFPFYQNPTRGVGFHLLDLSTHSGEKLRINCWDIEGNDNLRARRERCYKQCDYAIIMFDFTKKSTHDNVLKWYKELHSANKGIQIVICGNKLDEERREVISNQINYSKLDKLQYYEASAKSMSNVGKPFLYLAMKFARDRNLEFGKPPPGLTQKQLQKWELTTLSIQRKEVPSPF